VIRRKKEKPTKSEGEETGDSNEDRKGESVSHSGCVEFQFRVARKGGGHILFLFVEGNTIELKPTKEGEDKGKRKRKKKEERKAADQARQANETEKLKPKGGIRRRQTTFGKEMSE